MTLLVAITAGIVAAAGLYLLLSRDLLRIAVGTSVLGTAAVLTLLTAGGFAHVSPPILQAGEEQLVSAADPVSQALVLTAIVIAFALTCLAFVLMLGIVLATGSDDAAALADSEPPAVDPVRPAPAHDDVERAEDPAPSSGVAS